MLPRPCGDYLRLSIAALISTSTTAPALADRTQPDAGNRALIEEVVVYGRAASQIGTATSASEGFVGYADIDLPPLLRVGELVESIPGMVATQHSGTGKANQYFIRGFNLDHGTDFAVSVEGVPINMRSHGHGQGYLDLNFLIPELVETAHFHRGPYAADVGDFTSAASMDFTLATKLDSSQVSATVGEHGFYRLLAAGSNDVGASSVTAAVDATTYEGPWQLDEDLEQLKWFASFDRELGAADLRVTLQGFDASWNSTDQIPQRAVRSGLIGATGNLDDDLGGETRRIALTAALSTPSWSLTGYAIDYDFTLLSNFTYFLDNPIDGDEFEQRDSRRIVGLIYRGDSGERFAASGVRVRWGGDVRFDDIDEVGLFNTVSRQRINTVRDDTVEQLSLAAWSDATWALTERLRVQAGARFDWMDWSVDAFRQPNSGTGSDSLISPKASLAWRVSDGAELYLSAGRGFHSNDVRGATIGVDPASGDPADPVPVLVRSDGAELGLRIEQGERFNATLTAFWLELDSELVYVGDAGSTEANDGSERHGFEAAGFWQANRWLSLNAAYTTTNARFKVDQGGGREIPGAVESTFTLGANAVFTNGWSASTRVRWLDEAPLSEDNAVRSDASLLVNAGVRYRRGSFETRLDAFNLLDSDDDDIAYFYGSRLPGEAADGVEDVHFHPLEPRSVRLTVAWHWE